MILVDHEGSFFRLVLKESFHSSGLFVGWPSNVLPIHDIGAVAANKFYIIGKIMATCLIQGGQSPLCICHAVAEYLVFDEIKFEPILEDIPDVDVRQGLLQVDSKL